MNYNQSTSSHHKLQFILILLMLSACVSQEWRFKDYSHTKHPAVKLFLNFEKEVHSGVSFEDLVKDYYAPSDHKSIEGALGWALFPWSVPYRAVSDGKCISLELDILSSNRVMLTCKGSIYVASLFQGKRPYDLELKLRVKKIGDRWFLGRSGLKQTPENGNPTILGLKLWNK